MEVERHGLYSSNRIVRKINSFDRDMQCALNDKNYNILVGKPQEWAGFKNPSARCEDNIQIYREDVN